MPAKVAATLEELLAEYEAFLTAESRPPSPRQPGLDDAAIERLETEHGFRLPDDLRALYLVAERRRRGRDALSLPTGRFLPAGGGDRAAKVFKAADGGSGRRRIRS